MVPFALSRRLLSMVRLDSFIASCAKRKPFVKLVTANEWYTWTKDHQPQVLNGACHHHRNLLTDQL